MSDQQIRGNSKQEHDQDRTRGTDDQGNSEDREEVRARNGIPGPSVRSGRDELARWQPRVRSASGSRKQREAPGKSRKAHKEEGESRETDERRQRRKAESAVK